MKLHSATFAALFITALAFFAPSIHAQSASFTQQPAATLGVLGGTADFSFSVQVPLAFANLGVVAYKTGVSSPVSDRFAFVSQSVGNNLTNSGNFTTGSYTIRISNLTAADVGSYYFTVSVNGFAYPGSTSQPADLVLGSAAAPVITVQPLSQNVAGFVSSAINLSVSATGNPSPNYQWYKNGTAIGGATSSTYTAAVLATGPDAGAYYVVVSNSAGSVTSSTAIVNVNVGGGPTIVLQPASLGVVTGQSATFSVTLASTLFTPSYVWLFNNNPIPGATSSSYSVTSASAASAGAYSVLIYNTFGSVTSSAATLSVTASAAPNITSQPTSTTVDSGTSLTLRVTASGASTPTYQWSKNGTAIVGANSSALSFSSVQPSDAADYSVLVSNLAGSVRSSTATVTVNVPNPARIINMSILSPLAAGETMTLGTVLGPAGTTTKPLLVRAGGPGLGALGYPDVIPDPLLKFFNGAGVTVGINDNWGGTASLTQAFNQVGAFAFPALSKDAAIYSPTLAAGSYTLQVSDAGGASGNVIAEIYDSTPSSAFTNSTPRLVNVSVLKQVPALTSLTAGFVIGGVGTKQVLIRAVGPGLVPLGVSGAMADPTLSLYGAPSNSLVQSNDNWNSSIAAIFTQVGAFALPAGSKDAAILATLAPGSYTAQVTGSAGGLVLVEVYEVP